MHQFSKFRARYVEKNLEKAFELYSNAADEGDIDAQYTLAQCYEHGKGCKTDVKKAIEIYKEIVESDDVDFKDDALADLKRLNADEDNNNSNVSNTPHSKKRSSKDSIDAVSSKKQKK